MKLVDILARELAAWPETTRLAQDSNGHVFGWTGFPNWDGDQWLIDVGASLDKCRPGEMDLADDHMTSSVTRAEWQAAIDALNADKCEHSYANNIGCPECGELNASKVVEWDGEGLPPVGSTCEHSTDDNKNDSADGGWKKVKIVGHHQFHNDDYLCAVWVSGTDVNYSSEGEHFRPIRTAEQVAAEEREKAIDKLVDVFESAALKQNYDMRGGIAAIYDAVYRKEKKPCGS